MARWACPHCGAIRYGLDRLVGHWRRAHRRELPAYTKGSVGLVVPKAERVMKYPKRGAY